MVCLSVHFFDVWPSFLFIVKLFSFPDDVCFLLTSEQVSNCFGLPFVSGLTHCISSVFFVFAKELVFEFDFNSYVVWDEYMSIS